jgi:uncharacterized protein YciI
VNELGSVHASLHPLCRLKQAVAPVRVVVAGPLRDDEERPIGSLVIVEAASIDLVRDFVKADPYSINGIYDTVDIRPFAVTIGALDAG